MSSCWEGLKRDVMGQLFLTSVYSIRDRRRSRRSCGRAVPLGMGIGFPLMRGRVGAQQVIVLMALNERERKGRKGKYFMPVCCVLLALLNDNELFMHRPS